MKPPVLKAPEAGADAGCEAPNEAPKPVAAALPDVLLPPKVEPKPIAGALLAPPPPKPPEGAAWPPNAKPAPLVAPKVAKELPAGCDEASVAARPPEPAALEPFSTLVCRQGVHVHRFYIIPICHIAFRALLLVASHEASRRATVLECPHRQACAGTGRQLALTMEMLEAAPRLFWRCRPSAAGAAGGAPNENVGANAGTDEGVDAAAVLPLNAGALPQ